MNLLIDFLTAHGLYGAGEYHRRVVKTLLNKIKTEQHTNIHLFAVYDSRTPISFTDMQEQTLTKEYDIQYIDLKNNNLAEIIQSYKIDRFFISCGQRIGIYPEIKNIKCEVICVTHDFLYEEWHQNHLYEFWLLNDEKWSKKHHWVKAFAQPLRLLSAYINTHSYEKELSYMRNVVEMLNNNKNSIAVTVSEYSKHSMTYHLDFNPNQIRVLYSPSKIEAEFSPIQSAKLKDIIDSGKKYYIMVSADRESKNAPKAINAFKIYNNTKPNDFFVIIGYKGPSQQNIISIDYLCDSDFTIAIKNCYALIYPSYFEGFGYPPIEAAKYGKPSLCSNTTSIPEVMEDAPVYFSPFYESGIFKALLTLNENNYAYYSEKALKQYEKINNRQEKDLNELIKLILK